jgi:hypothetical protein
MGQHDRVGLGVRHFVGAAQDVADLGDSTDAIDKDQQFAA